MLAADGTPQEVVNRREMESLYDMKLLIRNNPLLEKPEIVPIRVMNEKPIVADIPFGTGNIRNLDGLENIKGKLYIHENIVLTSHFFPTHTLLLAKTKGFKVFC